MRDWYKKELIRCLVDMHIPNGEGYLEKFDPAAYAENVKRSGATAAYIYGSNCLGLCFFPTKIGLRHKQADRDIFGKTVDECRKRGLKVIGYLNSWGSFVSDAHPEWDVRYADGSSKREKSRFGNPCVNNDEYREYFTSLVYEFVSNYKLDGLWVDMVGMWAPVCHCESCKKKYGKALPTVIDLDDPAFAEYHHRRGKAVADFAEAIRGAAKRADPDITVALQDALVKDPLDNGLNDMRYYAVQDYLAGDFYVERSGVNVISRMLYRLSDDLPFEFMASRCASLTKHTMNKDINELILQACAAFMYKGAFLFIDAIDPSGETDSAFYDEISVIADDLRPYFKYADFEEKPIREVAVLYNFYSGVSSEQNGRPVDEMSGLCLMNDLKKIDSTLSAAHIDYDIITPKDLGRLGEYKVIVVPALEMMSVEETEAIRKFVFCGGNLYISALASLRDDNGNRYGNFMLSDVMGVAYAGEFGTRPCYAAPEDGYAHLFGRHTKKYPNMLDGKFAKVKPCGAGKTVAKVTLPVSSAGDRLVFSSAISDPPMIPTDHPALYENAYGSGRAIYSAGKLESDPFVENKRLFADIIKYLAKDLRVTVSAPECVDCTVYEKDDRLMINLLNSQTVYPPVKIGDILVSVDVGGKTVKSVTDVSGGLCSWTLEKERLFVRTDLSVYKLIAIGLGRREEKD